jgi:hypothetical protein
MGAFTASPNNPQVVWWGNTMVNRYQDYGQSIDLGPSYGWHTVHADVHKYVFRGNDLYVASDGGISKIINADDLSNLPSSTVDLSGIGLSCGAINGLSVAPNNPDIMIVGQIDDGSVEYNANSSNPYSIITGSDGGKQCAKNDQDMVTSISYGNFSEKYTSDNFTYSTGIDKGIGKPCGAWGEEWNNQMQYEPNTDKFYFKYNDLYICDPAISNTSNWNSTSSTCDPAEQGWQRISEFFTWPSGSCGPSLHTFKIAESNPNVIYLSVDYNINGCTIKDQQPDGSPVLLYSTNSGGSWNSAIPGYGASNCYSGCWTPISTVGLCGLISSIATDPLNPNRVWIASSGFANGGNNSHIMFSSDGGANWSDYSSGLPDLPVNKIIYEKNSNDMIYAGTEVGIYYRGANMSSWQKFGDLPDVIVNDLDINYIAGIIRAGTFGRGVWESYLACPQDLSFNESGTYTQNKYLEAQDYITSTATVNSGYAVTYRAGTYVDLLPGFDAKQGSSFHAFIYPCTESASSKINHNNNSNESSINKVYNVKPSFTVMPNPSDGNFRVAYKIPETEQGTFEIFDITGRQLFSSPLKGGDIILSLDLSSLEAGVYFYHAIVNNKRIAADRIVVIK